MIEAEAIREVVESLVLTAEEAVKIVPFQHKNGEAKLIVGKDGYKALATLEPVPPFQFPKVVTVGDLGSFVSYIKDFDNGDTACFASERGVIGVIDYAEEKKPLERTHSVFLPASYSPDTAKPVGAIKSALGKWIKQEELDELVQVAGIIVQDTATFLEAINDLEGVEVTKVQRTASKHSIGFTGEVKGKGEVSIPKDMSIRAVYMGQQVSALIPIRAAVQQNQIKFQLIDNGAFAAAEMTARRTVIAQARHELGEGISVFEGSIS